MPHLTESAAVAQTLSLADVSHLTESAAVAQTLSLADVARSICIGAPIAAAAQALCHAAGGERLRAPLSRLVHGVLLGHRTPSHHQRLAVAFERLRAAPGGGAITLADVIDALCTGSALDMAVEALCRARRDKVEACGTGNDESRAPRGQAWLMSQQRKREREAASANSGPTEMGFQLPEEWAQCPPCAHDQHGGAGCDCDPSCTVS